MLNILPFEIISRNTKTLLITYISSVDISHEGMKKILESLHTQRGIIPESYLDELLDYESIDKDKGKEFLVTTGVINKTKASSLWEHSVIISDVPHLQGRRGPMESGWNSSFSCPGCTRTGF